jgi:hypothetical protein
MKTADLAADIESLAPVDRPIRRDLESWAILLTKRLAVEERPRLLSAAFNETALIFAHLGFTATAKSLCESQLTWVSRLDTKRADNLALAVQPWINMGRLGALANQASSDVSHLSLMSLAEANVSVRLGPCSIPGDAWSDMFDVRPDLVRTLWSAAILDRLRQLFKAAKYQAALHLLEGAGTRIVPDLREALLEGKIMCFANMEAWSRVARIARDWQPSTHYMAAVRDLHAFPGAMRSMRLPEARASAANLNVPSPVLLTQAGDCPCATYEALAALRFFQRHIEIVQWLGMSEYVQLLAERWLNWSAKTGDQVSQASALTVLTEVSSSSLWAERLRELRTQSDYAAIRFDRAVAPKRLRVYSALLHKVQGRLGCSTDFNMS